MRKRVPQAKVTFRSIHRTSPTFPALRLREKRMEKVVSVVFTPGLSPATRKSRGPAGEDFSRGCRRPAPGAVRRPVGGAVSPDRRLQQAGQGGRVGPRPLTARRPGLATRVLRGRVGASVSAPDRRPSRRTPMATLPDVRLRELLGEFG